MRFQNARLDRIWLWAIALSFALMAPIWLILSVERMGWRLVIGSLALALGWRYRKALRAMTEKPFAESTGPAYLTGMSCGCHGLMRCERHQLMLANLAERHRKSSTALENISKPASSIEDGPAGPR